MLPACFCGQQPLRGLVARVVQRPHRVHGGQPVAGLHQRLAPVQPQRVGQCAVGTVQQLDGGGKGAIAARDLHRARVVAGQHQQPDDHRRRHVPAQRQLRGLFVTGVLDQIVERFLARIEQFGQHEHRTIDLAFAVQPREGAAIGRAQMRLQLFAQADAGAGPARARQAQVAAPLWHPERLPQGFAQAIERQRVAQGFVQIAAFELAQHPAHVGALVTSDQTGHA